MDERQCYSSARTIGFSWAKLNHNEIRAVSATNRFSRHLCGFHQGVRSTMTWRSILQTTPNELSTWTRELHHSILEEPQVLHRNESNHLEHLRDRERSASRIMSWANSISSLSLWIGSTYSVSHTCSSVRRWPCIDRQCLSMVASIRIRIANAKDRSESIEWSPSLCRRVETADQFLQKRMTMDTSTSVHSNTLSHDWWTLHKTNIRIQVPWLSRRWTSLIQKTLHTHAPKSPKELYDPEVRDPIENIISESEKAHLSSLLSTLSANDLRGLTTVVHLCNWQLSRLIHNWWNATNDEVRWLLKYETAELKAQRFLRRFIDKAETISPELLEDYILGKAMPMYLRMHIEEEALIDALPRGRLNRYTSDWINPPVEERRKCYMDRLSTMLTKQRWERTETSTRKGLKIGTYCRVSYSHYLCLNKSLNTIIVISLFQFYN